MKLTLTVPNVAGGESPSTRREWIEIVWLHWASGVGESPSTRREWIEMLFPENPVYGMQVSLHTEGVD